jgi:hypothetical protein
MIKRRTSARRSSRTKSKKTTQAFPIFCSWQTEDGEWKKCRVGTAFPKEKGRFSLAITPLASWVGGDPEVSLSFFTEPFEADDDDDDDIED